MASQTIILTGPAQREHACRRVMDAPDKATVHISGAKEARTKAQNRLIHRWYTDVATALGDQTSADVKVDCNIRYGRPILARDDPEWAESFDAVFSALDIEAKRKMVKVLDVPFTRRMNVKQLSEYMDQMQRDYAEVGIRLTDPEAQKYAAEFGA